MYLLRPLALTLVVALAGCATIELNTGKFSDDKYFCSTLRGYQSYLESYHVEHGLEERFGVEELGSSRQSTGDAPSGDFGDAEPQISPEQSLPRALQQAVNNEPRSDHPLNDQELETQFEAPHVPGRRLEDTVTDRSVDVMFCLEKGGENIYFGWMDAKYDEFVWSDTPLSLRIAIERSCTLQSFPISTRGQHVKDSRIQVLSARMRTFLAKARQSGESQVRDCPEPAFR